MKIDSKMAPMLIVAIFSAVLGMFQFGFNTGAINSPSEAIKNFINDIFDTTADIGSSMRQETKGWMDSGRT